MSKQSRRKSAESVIVTGDYEFDKFGFFRTIGYEPRDNQARVHRSEALFRVVACGVRWGKSKMAHAEGLAEAMRPKERSVGWVVAPTYDLANKVFREILFTARNHLRSWILDIVESRMVLKLKNSGGGVSEIVGKTGDNADSLLGEACDWQVIDEASRLKPAIWQSYLSQRLLDKGGWALFPSTPKGKNWFYQLYLRGLDPLQRKRYESFSFPTSDNPLVDPQLIEEAKAELPEAVYQQEFEARFLDGGGLVFRRIRDNACGVFRKPDRSQKYFMGVDLAKSYDYSVLCCVDESANVVAFDRFNHVDWNIQKQRIKAMSDAYNGALITMDASGMGGDMFHEDLIRMGLPVEPFIFTEASKRQLIDTLVVMMENGSVSYPPIPELMGELEAFSYEISPTGRLKRAAPSGFHDDCVIALALAVNKVARVASFGDFSSVGQLESIDPMSYDPFSASDTMIPGGIEVI